MCAVQRPALLSASLSIVDRITVALQAKKKKGKRGMGCPEGAVPGLLASVCMLVNVRWIG